MKKYKIAVIGLGSIGSRHIYNLSYILDEKKVPFSIDVIRNKKNSEISPELSSIINNVYYTYEEVPSDYDIIFITNPTYLHYDTIKKYVSKTLHMFIEKPVFDNTNMSIEDLELKDNGIYYVACPIRYTDVIQYVKNNVDLNKVYSARVICSSYLPEWRPNVDYRKIYSAHADQGGGVSIDLIHYLFGQPKAIHNFRGKVSNLEIDSDDLSIYIAKYEKMMVELHLDYFGRKIIREIELFTGEDTIVADIANSEIRYLKSGRSISFKETRNDFQRKEIAYFFDIIEGKSKNHNDIQTAMKTLKITQGGV